jgi:phosphate-selective porin OprO/OprP
VYNTASPSNVQALQHKAWQLSSGYVLTGEDAGYKGVVPKQNFSLDAGTWGAFEVVGRVSNADIDDGAFTGGGTSLANPSNAATEIDSYAVGLNWYLSKSVRASFDAFYSSFKWAPGANPASNSVIYDDEKAFVTRLQLIF